jgi:TolB-like protein
VGRKLLYLFEDYGLDTDRRELSRGTSLIPVEPKVFDLLVYVIRNREHVVSKDDLVAAIWNGRVVSESALTTCINAARTAIGDSGEAQRLIKTLPRKGIRFVGIVREDEGKPPAAAPTVTTFEPSHPSPALPDKPSIAILPFANLSGDPEQEYFADGMVEDIITALSRFRNLFVIARNSSFTYKGRAVDIKRVGRELGVRYVLEGSVRKAGDRLRITGQLIDASTGATLWADRFDGAFAEVFDLHDQVAVNVVGAIAPTVEDAEIERAKRKPTESLNAYDHYLRALAVFHGMTREANDEALRLFYKAIERDPEFALAYARAAHCFVRRKAYGWMVDRAQETAEAARLARRAGELGRNDAVALSYSGHSLGYVVGDLDDGAAFVERALVLNSNLAAAWGASSWMKICFGEPDAATKHAALAMRLSPLDPRLFVWQHYTALAHLCASRYDDAALWAERAMRGQPNFASAIRIAAASYALAGRPAEAQKLVGRLRQLDPQLCLSNLGDVMPPFRRPEDRTKYVEGLRIAGLPD